MSDYSPEILAQAAVEAIARMNAPYAWRFHDTPGNDPDWLSEIIQPSLDYAAELIQAATPHLRAAWAAELGATFQSGERWNATYRKGLRTLQYEKAYLDGVIDIIALLEGGGE